MHSLVPAKSRARSVSAAKTNARGFQRPHYDSEMTAEGLSLQVYLPGVAASGVEITTCGPDLTLVARKHRPVRVNWHALQLERVSPDYRLHLKLGQKLDLDAFHAEFLDGTLVLRLPLRASRATGSAPAQPQAA